MKRRLCTIFYENHLHWRSGVCGGGGGVDAEAKGSFPSPYPVYYYCIFRGGLPAVKCGRKSDYDGSSVPARNRECDGATAQQRNPPFPYFNCSNKQQFFPPTHPEEWSVRHRQEDWPPDPRVLFSSSRAPCYKSHVSLTPIGTLYD